MSDTKGKILIVDDEASIRFVLAEALRMWGYDTVEAGDAASARAVFAQEQPVAVVTDINLPDGSGLILLREFKRRTPPPVVIVITGEVIVENTISALRGDADDFISKPVNIHELQLALNRSLAVREPAASKPSRLRILLVADTEERLKATKSIFSPTDADIAVVKTAEELEQVCLTPHELAVIDLEPEALEPVLRGLRENPLHGEIPLLVSAVRLIGETSLDGVLPRYRAMPCSPAEMAALVQRRTRRLREMT